MIKKSQCEFECLLKQTALQHYSLHLLDMDF